MPPRKKMREELQGGNSPALARSSSSCFCHIQSINAAQSGSVLAQIAVTRENWMYFGFAGRIFLNLKTPVPQMYTNGIAKCRRGDQQPGELLLHAKLTVTNALLLFPACFVKFSSFSIKRKRWKSAVRSWWTWPTRSKSTGMASRSIHPMNNFSSTQSKPTI